MADEKADDSQADDVSKSQVDEKTEEKTDDQTDKSQVDTDKSQVGESKETKKLRSENHSLRTRLRKLEEAQTKAENEKLSETDRLKKERDDLAKKVADSEARMLEVDRREAFLAVAADDKRQIRNARALYRIVKDDIEFEDGEITNLDSLLKKAKAEAPELFGARANGSADGGSGSREGNKGGDMNSLIRGATGRA